MAAKQSKKAPKPRRKPGPPGFTPTADDRRIVLAASGMGIQHIRICKLVLNPETGAPIDTHTLRKHFRTELDRGMAQTHLSVGTSLYNQACGVARLDEKGRFMGWIVKPDTAATIWFTKAQMGYSEKIVAEHEYPDGVPVQEVKHGLDDLSRASLADLAATYRHIAAGGDTAGPASATGRNPAPNKSGAPAGRRSAGAKGSQGAPAQ